MSILKYKDKNAQKIHDDYVRRINRFVRKLPKEERTDLVMEFESHIYEGMQRSKGEGEVDSLLGVLERLGAPEEVLEPMVAEKKLEQATRTFNPKHVFQALLLNLRNGIAYTVFGLLYLVLGLFGILVGSKLLFPDSTGFYVSEDTWIIGIAESGMRENEVLGYWFIPAALLVIVVLYLILTFLLRLWSRRK